MYDFSLLFGWSSKRRANSVLITCSEIHVHRSLCYRTALVDEYVGRKVIHPSGNCSILAHATVASNFALPRFMQSLRSVPLQAFCSSTRQWVPLSSLVPDSAESKSTISPTKPFTVITYNVFAGPGSENLPHLSHRTKGVLSILERSKADVIALQEVSLGFERSLRREKWLRAQWVITSLQDYFLSSTHGLSHTLNARNGDDGCLLAIRRALIDEDIQTEAEMLRLSGSQGKVLVSAQTVNGVRGQ